MTSIISIEQQITKAYWQMSSRLLFFPDDAQKTIKITSLSNGTHYQDHS